ncbi:MAG: archaeosortase/exosortase family protein [Bacteroidota bacterium]
MLKRNAPLLRFFAILLGVFAVWFVVYDLWLLPDGRLDAWLSYRVAAASAGILDLFGAAVVQAGRVVRLEGGVGVEVADGCNGLTTIGLFVGFVLAFPGSWKRRLWFIPLGIGVVLLANILRVAALALVQVHWPAAFDVLHSFGISTFFYAVVFVLWVVWARLGDELPTSKPPQPPPAALTPASS